MDHALKNTLIHKSHKKGFFEYVMIVKLPQFYLHKLGSFVACEKAYWMHTQYFLLVIVASLHLLQMYIYKIKKSA